MKSNQQLFRILILCFSILFFSKNVQAQCSGFNVNATQTGDGSGMGDASVQATATGGSGTVYYTWHNSLGTAVGISSAASGLIAGTYCVVALDSNSSTSCRDTFCLTVTDTGTANCSNFSTSLQFYDSCHVNDVTLYVNTNGGSGNYTYTWSTGDSSRFVYYQSAGTYAVTITDNIFGCIDTLYKTVVDDTCNPCVNFSAYVYEYDPCQQNDITLTVYPIDSIGNRYSYLWNTGSTGFRLINQSSGSYWVLVTDSVTGCSDTAYITVVDDTCNPCANFSAYVYESDSCQLNDVNLTAYSNRNTGTFLWSTGATSSSISNATTGSYWVLITDSTLGCSDTAYITVVDDTCNPCANFNAYVYETDSCQYNDVSLTAYSNRGSAGASYLWSTGATSSSISNVSNGSYWVLITDTGLGCSDTAYITVVDDTCNPCDNFNGYIWKNDGCKANDVNITTFISQDSNQIGNIVYTWSTGATMSNLVNVGSGTYTVTITDTSNGCSDTLSIIIVDSVYKCCTANFYTYDSLFGASSANKRFSSFSRTYDGSNITNYNWTYGDGTSGTGNPVYKSYSSSGTYTVCHSIITSSGCKDTSCKTVIAPPPGRNLKVNHYGIPYIRDTNRYLYICYRNLGTTTENGIVEYKYPAGMSLVYSSKSVMTHIGNKISFNVGTLTPGQGGCIYIKMRSPSSFTLGTVKCDTATILPIASDVVVSNNTSYECDSVVGSYDPNDKMPSPKGIGEEGAISPDTKEISYLIRFENEGNWRTYTVRVEDEIDPSFDINSLLIGDVSHNFRLVKTGRKLVWYFDNIELTPKSVDPDRSHGYIQYSLQLNSGLPVGTQLKNTAYIYFDKNPAIITNTTKNTLKVSGGSSSIASTTSSNLNFEIIRFGKDIEVQTLEKMTAVRVFDVHGKRLLDKTLDSNVAKIPNLIQSNGVYIIHVDIGENTIIRKYNF